VLNTFRWAPRSLLRSPTNKSKKHRVRMWLLPLLPRQARGNDVAALRWACAQQLSCLRKKMKRVAARHCIVRVRTLRCSAQARRTRWMGTGTGRVRHKCGAHLAVDTRVAYSCRWWPSRCSDRRCGTALTAAPPRVCGRVSSVPVSSAAAGSCDPVMFLSRTLSNSLPSSV
jgi:hypothetical protein